MEINNILDPIDNLFKKVDENKIVLILIILLVGIYTSYYSDKIGDKMIDIFSDNRFKLVLFIIISYISSSSPAIGISLTIAIMVTLQVISGIKIRRELDNENFSQIESSDFNNLENIYLKDPILLNNDLSPIIELDLKLEKPSQIYENMIKSGKSLLDNSVEIEKDYENRLDKREQQIASITRRDGIELVKSGLNRLQNADQGEYNNINEIKKPTKFIKYSKMLEENKNNPAIMAIYMEMINNYMILTTNKMDREEFDIQLRKVYENEYEFLVTIYKYKKEEISGEYKKIIEEKIEEIKELKKNNENWIIELKELIKLLC